MDNQKVYELFNEIKNAQHETALTVAKIEVNQKHFIESLQNIKEEITQIKKIDKEQTESLQEHMRRSDALEAKVALFKEQLDSNKLLLVNNVEKINKNEIKNETKSKQGKSIREIIAWIIAILVTIFNALLGLIKLLGGDDKQIS